MGVSFNYRETKQQALWFLRTNIGRVKRPVINGKAFVSETNELLSAALDMLALNNLSRDRKTRIRACATQIGLQRGF